MKRPDARGARTHACRVETLLDACARFIKGVSCPHAGKKSDENGIRAEVAPEIVDGTGAGEAVRVFDRGPIRKNECGCLRSKPREQAERVKVTEIFGPALCCFGQERDNVESIATQSRVLAGIDVHKKMLAVVVRRDQNGETGYQQRAFGTTRIEIEHLAAWLQQNHVAEVVMESTAQYWRPVWYGMEVHFKLHLSHPLQTRAPRGRKRDFRDARRLVDRLNAGDLEESFIPGAEQRSWRWPARTRVDLQRKITRVRNQVEGVLEEGGSKLAAVVTDLFGVSGWSMLERMAAGETDTEALVELAQGKLLKKKSQLREALRGALPEHCRLLLRQQMEQVTLMRKQSLELSVALGRAMKEYAATLKRLCSMPGVDQCAAQALLAEIGPRAAAFATPEQLASWIGVCPGSQESAGVSYSTRSAKGNRHLRRILCQIAWAAVHSKGTFFHQLFGRLKPKIEAKGAVWAVAHRIAKVVWLILSREVEYVEKGPAPPNQRTLMRKLRRLAKDFALLGIDFNKALHASV